MLGSLARKLRILGYDVAFDKKSDDNELLRTAQQSGRRLVTSDIDLYLRAKKLHIESTLIRSRSEKERLYEVLSSAGVGRIGGMSSPRCSVCNGSLVNTGESTKAGKPIYPCTACGKKYWEGSHWRKLESLFMGVDELLAGDKEKRSSEVR